MAPTCRCKIPSELFPEVPLHTEYHSPPQSGSHLHRQHQLSGFPNSRDTLTEVHHVVAGPVERPGVELQSDDGEDDDGEEKEQSYVDQRTDSLGYGGDDDLETWDGGGVRDGEKIINKGNRGS